MSHAHVALSLGPLPPVLYIPAMHVPFAFLRRLFTAPLELLYFLDSVSYPVGITWLTDLVPPNGSAS
eukprot:9179157-Heterocapsa_arctica.AAC.1